MMVSRSGKLAAQAGPGRLLRRQRFSREGSTSSSPSAWVSALAIPAPAGKMSLPAAFSRRSPSRVSCSLPDPGAAPSWRPPRCQNNPRIPSQAAAPYGPSDPTAAGTSVRLPHLGSCHGMDPTNPSGSPLCRAPRIPASTSKLH